MKLPIVYLRDLFWLTVVVAMATAWFASYCRYQDNLQEHQHKLQSILDDHEKWRLQDIKEMAAVQRSLTWQAEDLAARERELGLYWFPVRYDVEYDGGNVRNVRLISPVPGHHPLHFGEVWIYWTHDDATNGNEDEAGASQLSRSIAP